MSECVVRMELPSNCFDCILHCDGSFADDNGYCRGIPPYMDYDCRPSWEMRPSWCPIICQLPEGHGDLIDRGVLLQTFKNADYETYNDYCEAFDTTEAAETIVPADTEERMKTV